VVRGRQTQRGELPGVTPERKRGRPWNVAASIALPVVISRWLGSLALRRRPSDHSRSGFGRQWRRRATSHTGPEVTGPRASRPSCPRREWPLDQPGRQSPAPTSCYWWSRICTPASCSSIL